MALFTIEDIVSSTFSDTSFDLEATELLEMVRVVTLQVDSLLAQYHAEHYDEPAIPAQLATMLQRAVSDIGTSLSSLQDRSHHSFHQLLMGEPKVSATYVGSLNELCPDRHDRNQQADNLGKDPSDGWGRGSLGRVSGFTGIFGTRCIFNLQ
jgi:hypothetical protein